MFTAFYDVETYEDELYCVLLKLYSIHSLRTHKNCNFLINKYFKYEKLYSQIICSGLQFNLNIYIPNFSTKQVKILSPHNPVASELEPSSYYVPMT